MKFCKVLVFPNPAVSAGVVSDSAGGCGFRLVKWRMIPRRDFCGDGVRWSLVSLGYDARALLRGMV